MLKNLFDLVVPKIVTNASEKRNSEGLQIRAKQLRQSVMETRNNIDPTELEQELHLHLERIYTELDHVVDVLAVCALKTKDECEQEIFSESKRCSVIPEFLFNEEYRTFSLYWRRVVQVSPKSKTLPGGIQSRRLPITYKHDDKNGAGFYAKTIFTGMSEERKEAMKETEDQFRRLRNLIQGITQIRRTIQTMDRHSSAYFDNAILYETKPRVKTSKPERIRMQNAEVVRLENSTL